MFCVFRNIRGWWADSGVVFPCCRYLRLLVKENMATFLASFSMQMVLHMWCTDGAPTHAARKGRSSS